MGNFSLLVFAFKGYVMARFTENTSSAAAQPAREQAAKWINLYLPTKDGGKVKIGAVPLNKSNGTHAAVMALLSTEEGAEKFMNALVIVVQEGSGGDRAPIEFDL
jgi:hypothetical protein